ncbi:uncharacterized protein LOC107039691 [Diachasma alloeum]|uniref:uncharacterized protein LOC107039691 n=1 Tax=Diachasma alloeum TaxID=454923 RepID=UPI00073828C8|nr:uncharacterized protein LOC107039691 [Diachasma alloeum]
MDDVAQPPVPSVMLAFEDSAEEGSEDLMHKTFHFPQVMPEVVGKALAHVTSMAIGGDDSSTHLPLKKDPTKSVQLENNKLVEEWFQRGHISEQTENWLKGRNSSTPRMHALPKIHKKEMAFRPIVVKDSFEFSEYIRDVEIPDGYKLISLHVSALFTKVPLPLVKRGLRRREETMDLKMPIDDLIGAVQFVMESTSFSAGNEYWKQVHGLPMAFPLAPTLAEVVMQDLEFTCLGELSFSIPFYKRYVDDIITAVPEDKVQEVVDIFNRQHERLKFTREMEVDGKIPFLNVLLIRQGNQIRTD